MNAGLVAFLNRMTHSLQRFLGLLDEIPVRSPDLAFLHTLLHHATGYLQKDIAPETEALENWDIPENQRMLRRYLRHLTHEIRMVVTHLPQEVVSAEASQPLVQRMLLLLHQIEAEQGSLDLLLRAQQERHGNGDH